MIRWWDYIIVFVYADIIQSLLFWGFTATIWWVPLVAGGAAGYLFRSWTDVYCKWRLRYEESK